MVDIKTRFAGLDLPSPVIIGSSGYTRTVARVAPLVEAGAGAVILKSLFEEQMMMQSNYMLLQQDYPEAVDYIESYVRQESMEEYLKMLREFKAALPVPIIASINCTKAGSWLEFAQKMEEAGAAAIELNVMRLEQELYFDYAESESSYIALVQELRRVTTLPLIVKLSRYHTNLPSLVDKLRAAGAAAVTLFNRGYQVDIDLKREQLIGGEVFSNAGEFAETLRYTGLVAGLVPGLDVSASSGVYSWEELTKVLLVGAQTAQLCTAIYKQGPAAIREAITGLKSWMMEHGYHNLDELCGRLRYTDQGDVRVFERIQFMKYFTSKDATQNK